MTYAKPVHERLSDVITNSNDDCTTAYFSYFGFEYQSVSDTRSPYWRTRSCMAPRHDTLDRSTESQISAVGGHCALPAPVAWWCRDSDCPRSAVGPSTSLHLGSGMDCPMKLFRHRHFQVFGADSNLSSFSNRTQTLSSNSALDTTVVLVVATIKIIELLNYWTITLIVLTVAMWLISYTY